MATGKLFIGRKVRELRLQGNMTQSQCAERLGISTSYLNQIENNQRPVSAAVLLALAEKFQLDLSELAESHATIVGLRRRVKALALERGEREER